MLIMEHFRKQQKEKQDMRDTTKNYGIDSILYGEAIAQENLEVLSVIWVTQEALNIQDVMYSEAEEAAKDDKEQVNDKTVENKDKEENKEDKKEDKKENKIVSGITKLAKKVWDAIIAAIEWIKNNAVKLYSKIKSKLKKEQVSKDVKLLGKVAAKEDVVKAFDTLEKELVPDDIKPEDTKVVSDALSKVVDVLKNPTDAAKSKIEGNAKRADRQANADKDMGEYMKEDMTSLIESLGQAYISKAKVLLNALHFNIMLLGIEVQNSTLIWEYAAKKIDSSEFKDALESKDASVLKDSTYIKGLVSFMAKSSVGKYVGAFDVDSMYEEIKSRFDRLSNLKDTSDISLYKTGTGPKIIIDTMYDALVTPLEKVATEKGKKLIKAIKYSDKSANDVVKLFNEIVTTPEEFMKSKLFGTEVAYIYKLIEDIRAAAK